MNAQLLPTPSRRAIVRGVAWTGPVVAIAAAAPMYAASPSCSVVTASSMNLTSKTGGDGTTLVVSSAFAGGATAGPWNLRTDDTDAMPAGWLEFENRPRTSAGLSNPSVYQDITLTFSTPVRDLTFDITDLDTSGGKYSGPDTNYWDAVAIQSTDAFTTTSLGSALTGVGSVANPWRQRVFTNSTPSSNAAASNRLTVSFVGPVEALTFRYWSIEGRSSYTGTQAAWIGNMTYKANCT